MHWDNLAMDYIHRHLVCPKPTMREYPTSGPHMARLWHASDWTTALKIRRQGVKAALSQTTYFWVWFELSESWECSSDQLRHARFRTGILVSDLTDCFAAEMLVPPDNALIPFLEFGWRPVKWVFDICLRLQNRSIRPLLEPVDLFIFSFCPYAPNMCQKRNLQPPMLTK